MSTTAMNRAVSRGIRRGIYLSATVDTTRLRELRAEAEETNYTAQTWRAVGNHLSSAMSQVEDNRPTDKVNSSQ